MTAHKADSYRGLIKIISLLGGASVLSVLFGLVRMKFAAVLLGPVGIGIIGLLQNVSGIATTLGDMGMRQSGAHAISRARAAGDEDRIRRVRETLVWMGIALATLVGGGFFLLRETIALRLLEQPALANDAGWLSIGIVATILAAPLTAILNGYQRVAEVGWITVMSALLSCVISVAALWIWREQAILVVVISAPVMLLCYSIWYVAKIGAFPKWVRPASPHLTTGSGMLKLGVYVMLSALVLSACEFIVRFSIQREFGMVEVGLFAAAWTIGVYYLNFLMVATSTEFFPRISAGMEDTPARDAAINLQLQSLCIASVPVMVALTAFCPLVLQILYSKQFVSGTSLLRLMAVGDVFRLSIYPLGFVLLAASHGRTYFLMKLFEGLAFAGLSALLLPVFGLEGVGMAHIATFTALFLIYQFLLRRHLHFSLSRRSIFCVLALVFIAIALSALAALSELFAALTGGVLVIGWLFFVIRLLRTVRTGQTG